MQGTLADIRKKLQDAAYENEEHVRFALVGRLLEKLGWDIWNPRQVYAEYVPAADEDRTKVDLALFSMRQPAVFIEVKAVGKAKTNLDETEKQLRNYNRDITAIFCVITDGAEWRFYYSKSQGRFKNKCFKVIDLLSGDLEDAKTSMLAFLSKANLDNGHAEKEAQTLLKLTQTQKVMKECLLRAKRMTQESPFPSLPDALCALVLETNGETVTRKEAEDFILAIQDSEPPEPIGYPPKPEDNGDAAQDEGAISLSPERPGSLAFTKINRGRFGTEVVNKWNLLVCIGIKLAVAKGHGIADLRKWMNAQVVEGSVTDRGFHPLRGTGLSFQYMETSRAWDSALALAKHLRCPIRVDFSWRSNESAAHPGRSGVLRWSP